MGQKQEDEPVLIVKKRAWIPEGKRQESILISICNHFRKEIGEKRRKIINKIKNNNKLRNNPNIGGKTSNIGKAAKELSDAMKEKKKKKKKKEKKKKKKEQREREKKK